MLVGVDGNEILLKGLHFEIKLRFCVCLKLGGVNSEKKEFASFLLSSYYSKPCLEQMLHEKFKVTTN